MKIIEAAWIVRRHKLKLSGTYSLDMGGLATCLFHCEECNNWWPLSDHFSSHAQSVYTLKIRAENLHDIYLDIVKKHEELKGSGQ